MGEQAIEELGNITVGYPRKRLERIGCACLIVNVEMEALGSASIGIPYLTSDGARACAVSKIPEWTKGLKNAVDSKRVSFLISHYDTLAYPMLKSKLRPGLEKNSNGLAFVGGKDAMN